MLRTLLPLVLGGSAGAVARWALHRFIDLRVQQGSSFPWGILAVNTLGCLFFGWLFGMLESRAWATEPLRLAVFTGFLGSFTTFSTFGWNTLELIRQNQIGLAVANVAASVLLGLVAVWAGFALSRG